MSTSGCSKGEEPVKSTSMPLPLGDSPIGSKVFLRMEGSHYIQCIGFLNLGHGQLAFKDGKVFVGGFLVGGELLSTGTFLAKENSVPVSTLPRRKYFPYCTCLDCPAFLMQGSSWFV